jgi:peptidoglycan/LPS O-acetylase OafA/YrhL
MTHVLDQAAGRPLPAVQPPPGQLPSLTAMRWGAALLVFLFHMRGLFGGDAGRIARWAFGSGAVGVSFFFVLSGFVLAWSARPGDGAVAFWRRRIARIYPVHLVTAAIAVAVGARAGGWPAIANLLLVSSWHRDWWQVLNPVSWSLVCEAFFYALFPVLWLAQRRLGPRGHGVAAILSVAAVIAVPWVNVHFALGWSWNSFPLARLPEFVLGMALAGLVRAGVWRGPGMGYAALLALTGYFLSGKLTGGYGFAACTVIGFACLICAGATADLRGTPSLWRHPWLVRLGEWSFAFYMVHLLVRQAVTAVVGASAGFPPGRALAVAGTVFVISLTLAWTLYIGVERPARRWIAGRSLRSARVLARGDQPEPAHFAGDKR